MCVCVCVCCSILLAQFATNPAATNASLLKMMHRIAHDHELPYVLYRLRLLSAAAAFLASPLADTDEFRAMRKFLVYLTRQFTGHAVANRRLLVDILFENSPKEAYEAAFGNGHGDDEEDGGDEHKWGYNRWWR